MPPFRVVAAAGGALAATVHEDHAEVLRLPGLEVLAEIGLDVADENDVTFASARDRLVVISRIGAQARVHLVDPHGPEKLAEAQFPTPLQLAAASGDFVLATSPTTTALIDASRRELSASSLPIRTAIDAAGAFGVGRFLISTGGLLEEWDARARAPTRRFRLARPLQAASLGGSPQCIWLVPRGQPDRIQVLSLTGGELQAIALPEPAARISSHPTADVLAVVGGRTGELVLVDLLAREGAITPLGRRDVVDVAWVGGTAGLLVGADARALELVTVALPVRTSAAPAASDVEPDEPAGTAAADEERATPPVPNTAQRLAAWRERVRAAQPAAGTAVVAPAPAPASPRPTAPPVKVGSSAGWRETIAAWTRGTASGAVAEPPAVDATPLLDVAARLGIDGDVAHGLSLAYGAHLCGLDGVAPVDLARAMGGRWEEALGGGRLGASGALVWKRSRARLAPEVAAAIDELAPRRGTVIGGVGGRTSVVALVVPPDVALAAVGGWAAAVVGSVLVPSAAGERRPRAFVLEALVRGVRPLVPARWLGGALAEPPGAAAVVVPDAAAAVPLGLTIAATWSRSAP